MLKKKLLVCSSVVALVMLSGCTPNIIKTKQQLKSSTQEAERFAAEIADNSNHLSTNVDMPFLGGTSFSISTKKPLPQVFSEIVHHHSAGRLVTLHKVMGYIREDSGMKVTISQDALKWLSNANANMNNAASTSTAKASTQDDASLSNVLETTALPLRFDGTLSDFLDSLTSHYDLFWKYDFKHNTIRIFHTETVIYNLNILPGETKTSTSIKSVNEDNDSNVTYSNNSPSQWDQAIETIESLNGNAPLSVEDNETYGMVTVTATPPVQKRIALYVDSLNKTSDKTIVLKIEVFNVHVDDSTNYGINWNAIYQTTQGKIAWNNTNVENALPISNSTVTQTATATLGFKTGAFAGSSLIASALQKSNHATFVTSKQLITQNGVPATAANVTNQLYLRNVQTTPLTNGVTPLSTQVQISTEQANLQTGTVMRFTPFVVPDSDQIRVNMSVNMTTLESMTVQKLGSSDAPTIIQSPKTNTQKSIQTFVLKSGETEVISGFTRNIWGVGTNSIGAQKYWYLGGAQATANQKVMTVILATPYVIDQH